MTYTTPNGIRYPNDPNAYADLVLFFKQMAEDVDTKFMPKKGDQTSTGSISSKYFRSTNGGANQSSTVFQTGPTAATSFVIFDDNVKLDMTPGRRLWIAGPNNSDVAIKTRSGSEKLNRVSVTATTVDINGAVTINGTLNVTGQRTTQARYEANTPLTASRTTWTAVPNAPGFTFVAPPSQAVTIGYGAMLPTAGTTVQLTYRVREGANLGTGNVVLDTDPDGWNPLTQPPPQSLAANGVGGAGGVQYTSVYTAYMLTSGTTNFQKIGLKSGDTYNIVPYYINQNASPALTLYRHYFVVTPDL